MSSGAIQRASTPESDRLRKRTHSPEGAMIRPQASHDKSPGVVHVAAGMSKSQRRPPSSVSSARRRSFFRSWATVQMSRMVSFSVYLLGCFEAGG